MCGIALLTGSQLEPTTQAIDSMIAAIAHRGPDGLRSRALPDCHLGHARLSIIDLATGDQPMADTSGRYWIVFNGEIYNYRELRVELNALGATFATSSDTETLLQAYIHWGPRCLDRLRGMFAFAIWDTRERELFAARDLFGEKPFYFAELPGGGLAAASEIRAISASPHVRTRLSRTAVDAYLAFGYVPPDQTIFENIQVLPPAHHLRWKNGVVRIERYWTPVFQTRDISLDDAAEQVKHLLTQAVRRQMVADVPIGAFLSGGLDSSSIVALMCEASNQPVLTYSVGFGELINELPYARAVAEKYGTVHHEIDLGSPDVLPLLSRMADVYDEPFADTSNIPTYLLCEFTRQHVKVALSGDGGDELFGGYGWYRNLALAEQVAPSRLLWFVFTGLTRAFGSSHPRLRQRAAAYGLAARWSDTWERAVMAETHIRPPERASLWGSASAAAAFSPTGAFKPDQGVQGLNRAFHFDLTSYLPGDLLVKVDRAAMAHGLETRAPMLDRDLVEFALTLPADLKVRGEKTKLVLHRAMEHAWPDALRGREKQGFGAPYEAWLRRPDVRAELDRMFAPGSALSSLLPGLTRNRESLTKFAEWELLVLGLWLERHESAV